MTPELALTVIPGFSDARVIRRLSDGPSNSSYQVGQGGETYVLRVDKPARGLPGLNRSSEPDIYDIVFAAGIAPEPVYFGPGVFVRRWVPGHSWDVSQLCDTGSLTRLAGLLRRLHQLPPTGPDLDLEGAVRSYAGEIGTADAAQIQVSALDALGALRALQDRRCLCHNDLVNSNILEAHRLMLIDLEYAAAGDPWFDLALVVQHHGLDENLALHFLDAYLQRRPGDRDIEHLSIGCRVYSSLNELYCLKIADRP